MDIDRYASISVAKDNSSTVGYVKQSGMRLSANEHLIPEALFTDPLDPNRPQGVSAVKALGLAASQGQKIFTLTAQNQAQHQALLAQISIDPQAMAEIQNGLAAGKEVTVHQSPVTQSGWTGSGYIITDPGTGAGAYKISGGANGGWFVALFLGIFITLIGLLIGFAAGPAWLAALAFAPFFALNWTFKNLTLNMDARGDMLIGLVELSIVFAFAFLNPIFLLDFVIELGFYSYGVYRCRY